MDDPMRPSQIVLAKFDAETDADRSRLSDRRGLSPLRLRARLSGDLDAIIAMAMRKEPDRRYPSVEALADDISRHLLGRPVLARQGDWRYNTAKFMRRHLLPLLVVAAAFLGLALIAGVTLWQNHRIEMARDATTRERDRAQQVSAFLIDVFSQADPYTAQGHDTTAKELLDRGAARIVSQNLQPEVRAQLLESIGVAYRRQGLTERAIPLFEQAVEIRRQEKPVDNQRTAAALANLARALTEAGHLVSAEAYLQQALEMSRKGDPSSSIETADILVQYAQFELNAKGDPQHSGKLFAEALGIYRSVLGSQHLSVAVTLSGLAATATWMDDFAAAEQYEREAIEIFRATVSRNYPDHAVALATLGYILTERGQYAEAEQLLKEALEIERSVFGEHNVRVIQAEDHLGDLYAQRGDLAKAIEATASAVAGAKQGLGADHYLTGYYLNSLATLYLKANDVPAAEAAAREALTVYARSLPPQHLYVATAKQTLGEVLLRRGSLAAAEVELRSSLEINTALAGADSWRTARSAASLGWVLIKRDKYAEGEPLLAAARARLLADVGAHHAATQEATNRLVEYYRATHRDAEAQKILDETAKH
jgi:tetratricopeptide (TPR) repeat protein